MATNIDDVTTCVVCFEPFNDPQILPCLHTFCKSCVDRIKSGSKIKCPTCSAFSDFSRVKPSFLHHTIKAALQEKENEMLAKLASTMNSGTSIKKPSAPPFKTAAAEQTTKCELCESRGIAHWCEDCTQWLCDSCKRPHLNAKITKSHRLTSLSDI